MPTTQSLATVKARLSEYLTEVESTHERVIITRNGRPAALLISVQDYESMQETLEILSDSDQVAALAQARQQLADGQVYELEQVRTDLARRRE